MESGGESGEREAHWAGGRVCETREARRVCPPPALVAHARRARVATPQFFFCTAHPVDVIKRCRLVCIIVQDGWRDRWWRRGGATGRGVTRPAQQRNQETEKTASGHEESCRLLLCGHSVFNDYTSSTTLFCGDSRRQHGSWEGDKGTSANNAPKDSVAKECTTSNCHRRMWTRTSRTAIQFERHSTFATGCRGPGPVHHSQPPL